MRAWRRRGGSPRSRSRRTAGRPRRSGPSTPWCRGTRRPPPRSARPANPRPRERRGTPARPGVRREGDAPAGGVAVGVFHRQLHGRLARYAQQRPVAVSEKMPSRVTSCESLPVLSPHAAVPASASAIAATPPTPGGRRWDTQTSLIPPVIPCWGERGSTGARQVRGEARPDAAVGRAKLTECGRLSKASTPARTQLDSVARWLRLLQPTGVRGAKVGVL